MVNKITTVNTVVNRQIAATTNSARPEVRLLFSQVSSDQVSGKAGSVVRNNSEDQVKRTQPDQAMVHQAVQNISDYVQSVQMTIDFSVDENSVNTVINVINPQTAEIIRQIAPEKAVNALQNLQRLEGLVLLSKARG